MRSHLTDKTTDIFNAIVILFSFSNIEETLKIISLIVALAYTARRWYLMEKNKNVENIKEK